MTEPTRLTLLPAVERATLYALREAARDGLDSRLLAALWLSCGQAAVERTASAVEGALGAIDAGARRRPLLAAPEAERLSAGERVLVGLLRAERDGRVAAAARFAEWLVRRPEQAPLRRHLRLLAGEFAAHGLADRAPRPAGVSRFIA